jgi:ABC-2 type transport system permease protein
MRRWSNIFRLGLKELISLAADPILMGLIVFAFTVGVHSASKVTYQLRNAAIAIVDQDHSPLSRSIAEAFLPTYFRRAFQIDWTEMDRLLDRGKVSFSLVFPPSFQKDVLAGRRPALQVNVDATNVMYSFIGTGYIRNIVSREIGEALERRDPQPELPIRLTTRLRFNPNLESAWFLSVVELVNQITNLSILLVGAAFLRERERGTLEHLLVLPVSPLEIMVSKVWANGLVVLLVAALSLRLVVEAFIGVPRAGSFGLFLACVAVYLFCTTSIGIYLGTVARSMPQFGLLVILVILPLQMLSGGVTPRESMPEFVRNVMLLAPTTHIMKIAQAILFRGAGFTIIWPSLAAITALGAVAFFLALRRMRITVTQTQL